MGGSQPFKTLPTTSAHRLVLKSHEAIINAGKAFAANPQLAETTQIIVINEEIEDDEEDQEEDEQEQEDYEEVYNIMIDNKFRAITAILTDCSRYGKLEAFNWHSGDASTTRPAEFWQALTKVAPTLQHLSFNFHLRELYRMEEMGISVTGRIFKSLFSQVITAF